MLTLVEPGFDLWKLEKVEDMRNDILMRIRSEGLQNMPGLKVGGPWPAEWIALFERWDAKPQPRTTSDTTSCWHNRTVPTSFSPRATSGD
jgi:hypothetical protein